MNVIPISLIICTHNSHCLWRNWRTYPSYSLIILKFIFQQTHTKRRSNFTFQDQKGKKKLEFEQANLCATIKRVTSNIIQILFSVSLVSTLWLESMGFSHLVLYLADNLCFLKLFALNEWSRSIIDSKGAKKQDGEMDMGWG